MINGLTIETVRSVDIDSQKVAKEAKPEFPTFETPEPLERQWDLRGLPKFALVGRLKRSSREFRRAQLESSEALDKADQPFPIDGFPSESFVQGNGNVYRIDDVDIHAVVGAETRRLR